MDSGYYAACTALAARIQALDLTANNLANSSTNGFRGQQSIFRSVLAQAAGANSIQQAVNNYGVLAGTRVDTSPGNFERTGNEFDLALEGDAFFAVKTPAGVFYTRNGQFQLSRSGELVNARGDLVLGTAGPLQVPAGKLTVGVDGSIATDGTLAGQLQIVSFPPGTPLQSLGNGYYEAGSIKPGPARDFRVRQGVLESSNVNPMAGAVELVEIQRQAELLQRVFTAFHSELNRTAAQELPRV
jgi:flagellar basal-body rod protein FlgF